MQEVHLCRDHSAAPAMTLACPGYQNDSAYGGDIPIGKMLDFRYLSALMKDINHSPSRPAISSTDFPLLSA